MNALPLRFGAGLFITGCVAVTASAAPSTGDLKSDFARALADFDRAQELQDRQPDRARQLYRSAAQRFKSLVSAGIVNGRLEYNLGNCYLQAGDVGKAILHYRRAARLIPKDPLLADNLAEARSRRLTSIQPTHRRDVLRSIFFWHYDTSLPGRSKAAVVLYVASGLFILDLGRMEMARSLLVQQRRRAPESGGAPAAGRVSIPIAAYCLDHPEGRLLFDAGCHPEAMDRGGRWPQYSPL